MMSPIASVIASSARSYDGGSRVSSSEAVDERDDLVGASTARRGRPAQELPRVVAHLEPEALIFRARLAVWRREDQDRHRDLRRMLGEVILESSDHVESLGVPGVIPDQPGLAFGRERGVRRG